MTERRFPHADRVVWAYDDLNQISLKRGSLATTDFDVAGKRAQRSAQEERPTTLEGIREVFVELHNTIPNDEPDTDYLARRLEATIEFIEASMGRPKAFYPYLERTTGVTPDLFPEEWSEEDRERLLVPDEVIERRGRELGRLLLELDPTLQFDRHSKERFDERFRLWEQAEIKKEILGAIERSDRDVELWLPGPHQEYEVKFFHNDRGNIGGITHEEGKQVLLANYAYEVGHTKARSDIFAWHEQGHRIQVGNLAKWVESGETNPALGIVTVHGPELFWTESTQILEHLANSDSPEISFRVLYTEYYLMVLHNLVVKINTGSNADEVYREARGLLPFEDPDRVPPWLPGSETDPVLRTYLPVLVPAREMVKGIAHLGDEEEKVRSVRQLFSFLHSAHDLRQYKG